MAQAHKPPACVAQCSGSAPILSPGSADTLTPDELEVLYEVETGSGNENLTTARYVLAVAQREER